MKKISISLIFVLIAFCSLSGGINRFFSKKTTAARGDAFKIQTTKILIWGKHQLKLTQHNETYFVALK